MPRAGLEPAAKRNLTRPRQMCGLSCLRVICPPLTTVQTRCSYMTGEKSSKLAHQWTRHPLTGTFDASVLGLFRMTRPLRGGWIQRGGS